MIKTHLILLIVLFSFLKGIGQSCDVTYVSSVGTGSGAMNAPTDLLTAISGANIGDVLRLDTGNYVLSNPVNLVSGITIEGGFIEAQGWKKYSTAGLTTIFRNLSNPDGSAPNDRVVAFYGNSLTNFRFQDITIEVGSAVTPGTSLYGVHLTNCSNYFFTRTQIIVGLGGNGNNGVIGTNGAPGIDGFNGTKGAHDQQLNSGVGGAGGAGAGGSLGGAGALDPPGGSSVGLTGGSGNGASSVINGGSGGGEDNYGGPGGSGGSVFGGSSNTGVGVGGGHGACQGYNGSSGTSGTNGTSGFNGTVGVSGIYNGGFFINGVSGTSGLSGIGGQGGAGGGGGGGQGDAGLFGPYCSYGAGCGGGGGGGGGSGGIGGSGGTGGGGSFSLFLYNNGAGGVVEQCFLIL